MSVPSRRSFAKAIVVFVRLATMLGIDVGECLRSRSSPLMVVSSPMPTQLEVVVTPGEVRPVVSRRSRAPDSAVVQRTRRGRGRDDHEQVAPADVSRLWDAHVRCVRQGIKRDSRRDFAGCCGRLLRPQQLLVDIGGDVVLAIAKYAAKHSTLQERKPPRMLAS